MREGDAETSELHVPISLSTPADGPIAISWRTVFSDGHARLACRTADRLRRDERHLHDSRLVRSPRRSRSPSTAMSFPNRTSIVLVAAGPTTPGIGLGTVYGLGRGDISDDRLQSASDHRPSMRRGGGI